MAGGALAVAAQLGAQLLERAAGQGGSIAQVMRTNERHWRSDAYFEGHPHLTERAAAWLEKAGAALATPGASGPKGGSARSRGPCSLQRM